LSYVIFAIGSGCSGNVALIVILCSRLFAGICGANITVAQAYIADITPPEKRSARMGLIGMAFGLGFILGPVLGGVSSKYIGLTAPGWVAASLCALNFIWASARLAESWQPAAHFITQRPHLEQWWHVLRTPRLNLLIAIFFLATFCFACFESTLPLLLGSPDFHPDDFKQPAALAQKLASSPDPVSARVRGRLPAAALQTLGDSAAKTLTLRRVLYFEINRLLKAPDLYDATAWQSLKLNAETQRLLAADPSGDTNRRLNRLLLEAAYPGELQPQRFYYDERHIGYLFAFCGLMSALVQGGMIGRLVKLFGEPLLINGSLMAVGGSLLIIPYAGTLGVLLLGLALVAMSSGLNRAPTMGLISIFTAAEEQGAILGVTQSAGTLGRIFGPLFATSAYALYPRSPYVAAAALCLLAGVVAMKQLPKRSDLPTHPPVPE